MLKGVKIFTTNCKIKYKNRDDLLFIIFEKAANVAGVFTRSSMAAASIKWCRKNIVNGVAKSLVVNAGNANAFTGVEGEKIVIKTAKKAAEILNCSEDQIFISSTGVIGELFDANLITDNLEKMFLQNNQKTFLDAAKSIMTTDSKEKIIEKKCHILDKEITIIAFAKGSGMIAPNMATMLSYIFTDANIDAKILQKLLVEAVENSFNSITVDSDQSTNDTVLFFATKAVNNAKIDSENSEIISEFKKTLNQICIELAKKIVIDGEGAKKLIEIEVSSASSVDQAREVAFSIANSPLVKTAIAGADPNWGRIIMAVGKSCLEADQKKIIVKIGDFILTKNGAKHPDYNENLVHQYLKNDQVKISVDLAINKYAKTVWSCDLNEEYIKINKDYRS
jgi:glutamate N-acetyltransferase/amino-acid N-acetyltransferase